MRFIFYLTCLLFLFILPTTPSAKVKSNNTTSLTKDQMIASEVDQIMMDIFDPKPLMAELTTRKPTQEDFKTSYGLGLGIGYQSNILESSNTILSDQYAYLFADTIFLWGKQKSDHTGLYFFADRFQYFHIESEGNPQSISSHFWIDQHISQTASLKFNAIFNYNHYFNETSTEPGDEIQLDISQEWTIKPVWQYEFTQQSALETAIGLTDSNNSDSTESYQEKFVDICINKKYDPTSSIDFSYYYSIAKYHEIESSDSETFRLETNIHKLTLSNHHYFILNKLSSKSSVTMIDKKDNDVGQQDYSGYYISASPIFKSEKWQVTGKIEYQNLNYRYLKTDDGTKIKTEKTIFDIENTYQASPNISIIASIRQTQYQSNNTIDNYDANLYLVQINALF